MIRKGRSQMGFFFFFKILVLMQSNAVIIICVAIDLGDPKSGRTTASGSRTIERFFCDAASRCFGQPAATSSPDPPSHPHRHLRFCFCCALLDHENEKDEGCFMTKRLPGSRPQRIDRKGCLRLQNTPNPHSCTRPCSDADYANPDLGNEGVGRVFRLFCALCQRSHF